MNVVPEYVTGVSHPMIREMYLKKEFVNGSLQGGQDILVIEMFAEAGADEKEHESFDSHLIDVLADLEDLKAQAESKMGHHFDRVDIRTH